MKIKFNIILTSIFIACLTILSITPFASFFAHAYSTVNITEQELYNQTNTYNVNTNFFDEDESFVRQEVPSVEDDPSFKYRTAQYHLEYDLSINNPNTNNVMTSPQITVLTPGLNSHANTWSNNLSNRGQFSYDSNSLINRIAHAAGGANIYWAKVPETVGTNPPNYTNFDLYDITDQNNEGIAYLTNTNSFATGEVYGKNHTGNVVAGGFAGVIENCTGQGYVYNCFTFGDVYARGNYSGAEKRYSFFGRLCGDEANNSFLNIYYNINSKFKDGLTGTEVTWNTSWYIGKTEAQLKTISFQVEELDLNSNYWNFVEGQFPTLK